MKTDCAKSGADLGVSEQENLKSPKQLIFCGFKENSRRHPFSRLSRGFNDEAAYISISELKVSYLEAPFAAPSFTYLPDIFLS